MEPNPSSRQKRDVYMYFDNDVKVRAPADAASFAQRLGASPQSEWSAREVEQGGAHRAGGSDKVSRAAIDPRRVVAVQEATARRTWPRVRPAKP